jgi:hypothetical protein
MPSRERYVTGNGAVFPIDCGAGRNTLADFPGVIDNPLSLDASGDWHQRPNLGIRAYVASGGFVRCDSVPSCKRACGRKLTADHSPRTMTARRVREGRRWSESFVEKIVSRRG